jgi:hypothetical protein
MKLYIIFTVFFVPNTPISVHADLCIRLIQFTSLEMKLKLKLTKLRGLIPRANYTDRTTAACRRSWCRLLRIEGATWSAWGIPPAVFSFSRLEPVLFLPQLYSLGWVDTVPDPLLLRKSGSAGNRARTSGSLTTRPQMRSSWNEA